MFRQALRLGSRVAVASTAAVVPVTAAACLSDSNTTYKCRKQKCQDASILEHRVSAHRPISHSGSPRLARFQNLAEIAEFKALIPAGERRLLRAARTVYAGAGGDPQGPRDDLRPRPRAARRRGGDARHGEEQALA